MLIKHTVLSRYLVNKSAPGASQKSIGFSTLARRIPNFFISPKNRTSRRTNNTDVVPVDPDSSIKSLHTSDAPEFQMEHINIGDDKHENQTMWIQTGLSRGSDEHV
jgi:hypothetical protein